MHTRKSVVAVPTHVQDSVRMYPREVTADGKTQHSRFCQATSSKWDWSRCHRCAELMYKAMPAGDPFREYLERKGAVDMRDAGDERFKLTVARLLRIRKLRPLQRELPLAS